MHRNPVKRGLVSKPEDWEWSSFRHYMTGSDGAVEIESFWTAAKRGNQLPKTQVSKARPGAPGEARVGNQKPSPASHVGRWPAHSSGRSQSKSDDESLCPIHRGFIAMSGIAAYQGWWPGSHHHNSGCPTACPQRSQKVPLLRPGNSTAPPSRRDPRALSVSRVSKYIDDHENRDPK